MIALKTYDLFLLARNHLRTKGECKADLMFTGLNERQAGCVIRRFRDMPMKHWNSGKTYYETEYRTILDKIK